MWKNLWRSIAPNPLDRLLIKAQKEGKRRILLYWNRGLGDIALGLYSIILRIRTFIPDASITFLTRSNLADGFALLSNIHLIVSPDLKRGSKESVQNILRKLGYSKEDFDLIIPDPDPTYWVKWQLGKITPKLIWREEWDQLWRNYPLSETESYIGAHVQTETNYASWRDWPLAHWHALFTQLGNQGKKILLFGFAKSPIFQLPNVIDLRGETPLFSLLSLIKNRCQALVVPDSGIASLAYFLDTPFPLNLISLWGDPHNGILKQAVSSPNPLLNHTPLIGPLKKIAEILPEHVMRVLSEASSKES